jgi:hypothetical protein
MTNPARPPLDWSGNVPFPGFTREAKIRLDADGRFWHEGQRVDHPGLAHAMHTWISRHPTDGRIVLENGWDWCYIVVEDTPFLVRGVRAEGDRLLARLSDESEEPLVLESLCVDDEGAIRCSVKHAAKGGPYAARFDRHAAQSLAEFLHDRDGRAVVVVGARAVAIASS